MLICHDCTCAFLQFNYYFTWQEEESPCNIEEFHLGLCCPLLDSMSKTIAGLLQQFFVFLLYQCHLITSTPVTESDGAFQLLFRVQGVDRKLHLEGPPTPPPSTQMSTMVAVLQFLYHVGRQEVPND